MWSGLSCAAVAGSDMKEEGEESETELGWREPGAGRGLLLPDAAVAATSRRASRMRPWCLFRTDA